ncbi:MAG: dethiobiotin synthase [Kofleriaceae bacterium]|nr:MAG: dethiobiotin synthase [Kofleriaceae bacterium]
MSLYVVTGTDTGVGKTFVTSTLVSRLRRNGFDAVALKPLETGWREATSDAAQLAAASGQPIDATVWAHFDLPAAPSVAAEAESRKIDLGAMSSWIRGSSGAHAHCFVEGAGGWMVPLAHDRLFCDLVEDLSPAGVVLVSASRLGTINHTLLTAGAIQRACRLSAIVLSVRPSDPPVEAQMHLAEISKRVDVPVFAFPRALDELSQLFHVEHQGR